MRLVLQRANPKTRGEKKKKKSQLICTQTEAKFIYFINKIKRQVFHHLLLCRERERNEMTAPNTFAMIYLEQIYKMCLIWAFFQMQLIKQSQ